MKALVVLKPEMSKRLIGRAVSQMPEVKHALDNGRIIIAGGTTNAYVAEELTGKDIHKGYYTAGIVSDGKLGVTDISKRLQPKSLVKGMLDERPWPDVLTEFEAGDIFIKGANAVDSNGNVGILVADQRGGTIGLSYGSVLAKGAIFLCPVSLEKLVPDVMTACSQLGIGAVDLVMGEPVGMIPLSVAVVITELEAFEILFDVQATHVASGGVNGTEGAVVILLEGDEDQVRSAYTFVQSIKNEKSVILD